MNAKLLAISLTLLVLAVFPALAQRGNNARRNADSTDIERIHALFGTAPKIPAEKLPPFAFHRFSLGMPCDSLRRSLAGVAGKRRDTLGWGEIAVADTNPNEIHLVCHRRTGACELPVRSIEYVCGAEADTLRQFALSSGNFSVADAAELRRFALLLARRFVRIYGAPPQWSAYGLRIADVESRDGSGFEQNPSMLGTHLLAAWENETRGIYLFIDRTGEIGGAVKNALRIHIGDALGLATTERK